jgi:hypothetical protein
MALLFLCSVLKSFGPLPTLSPTNFSFYLTHSRSSASIVVSKEWTFGEVIKRSVYISFTDITKMDVGQKFTGQKIRRTECSGACAGRKLTVRRLGHLSIKMLIYTVNYYCLEHTVNYYCLRPRAS